MTRPRSPAEPVRSRTAKARATPTSPSPMTDTTCAAKRARKSLLRSGPNRRAPPDGPTSVMVSRCGDFSPAGARSDFTNPTYEAHEAGAILGHHFAATPKGGPQISLPQPDPAILRKAQRNDERAFAIILRMYETPVYNYVLRLVGDRSLAEDLTQEVFLRVFQGLPRFSHRSKFTTWLFQVTKNRVLDELRAVERRPRLSVALDDVPPLEVIDQPVERLETIDAVWRAVNQLNVDLKMALLLRDVVGLSYNEIADSLEITLATVKWRIFKAREEVQLALSREGISFGTPKKAAVPATAAAAV